MTRMGNWATPQYVFDYFHKRHNYDLDLCAEPWSTKLPNFCSLPDRDAFKENLKGKRVWCNPPYDDIERWFELCKQADFATLLVPARTDRRWFQDALKMTTWPGSPQAII